MGTISLGQLVSALPETLDVMGNPDLTRGVNRVRILIENPRDEDCSGVLWVCPTWEHREATVLDRWILMISRRGATALVLGSHTLPMATRLLIEQLKFPVFIVARESLDRILETSWNLLGSAQYQEQRQELCYLQVISDAWRGSHGLEEFCHALSAAGIFLEVEKQSADGVVRVVDWGRGSGTSFSVDPPNLSRRIHEQLSLAIGVFLDREAAEIESGLRHRSEFLLELLVDPRVPTGSMIRAAQRYSLDLGHSHTAFIWDLDGFREFTANVSNEREILRIKGEALDLLEKTARQYFRHGMVLPHSDEFVLIVESASRLSPEEALAGALKIQGQLRPLLSRHRVSGVTCGIGFSYDGPEGLRKSFEEAHEALTVGRSRYGFGTVSHFKDLGLERFLYGWIDSPRSRQLAAGLLRPLINDPHSEELLETLRVYLESKGRLALAAQTLHIHRNTLRYRVERLQQVLQVSLSDATTQLILHLALKVLNDLHQNLS